MGEPATAGGRSRREGSVRILAVSYAVLWFGISAYSSYVLIYLGTGLGLSYALAGVLVGLSNATGIVFPLIGGGLADRVGRRRLLVAAFAVESAGIGLLALGAFERNLPLDIAGLLIARSAATLGGPAVSAYISDVTTVSNRAVAQAWMRTALNLGFTGGSAVGGALLGVTSFAAVATMAAGATSFGVFLSGALLPPAPFDRAREAVARRGRPSSDRVVTSSFAALRQAAAAPVRALLADRTLLLVWAGSCFGWTLNLQLGYAIPAYVRSVLGQPYPLIGALLALNAILVVIVQVPLTTALAGKRMTAIGVAGVAIYAAAFLGFGAEGSVRWDVPLVLVGLVGAVTVAECLVFYPVSTLSMNLAPAASRGAYSGAMTAGVGVGAMMAPLWAGASFAYAGAPVLMWAVLAVPAVPAAMLFGAARRRAPLEANRLAGGGSR